MADLKAQRVDVYKAIDSERKYQEDQRGNANPQVLQSHGDYLAAIQTYLNHAFDAWRVSRGNNDKVTADIRKIAALAVAAMEKHGAPLREEEGVLERAKEVLGKAADVIEAA